jgi:hypothetical protein
MSLCLLLWRQAFDHMVLNVIIWPDSLCVCSLIYVIMLINVVIRFASLWRNRRGQEGAFILSAGPVQNQIITVI